MHRSRRRVLLSGSGLSALLIIAHLTNDAFSSMLAALLPTLQERFTLSETLLATLVATLSFSSSVTQPFLGAVADRIGRRYVAGLGVILSSVLLGLMAVAPNPAILYLLLLIGGLGSGAFHPAGTAMARSAAGGRKGLAIGLFSAGGTVGLALGPLAIGFLIGRDLLAFSPWLMIPGVAAGLALIAFVPPQPKSGRPIALLDRRLMMGPVGLLSLAGILRSISYVTFVSAVPLWLVHARGLSPGDATIFVTLAVFSASASVGGIVAGSLERRLSRQWLITGSMLLALAPFGLIFGLTPGGFAYFLAVALAGGLVNGGLPLMVVSAQDLAPDAVGAASGMLMGFTWGVAGLLYIAIGALQEWIGIGPAMAISYLSLLPGALIAYLVLERHRTVLAAAD